MFCNSLIKLGEGGRISGLEKMQHCPKTVRFAKDVWTVKSCFRQGVTLKNSSEMLEGANHACGGLGRKSEVQAGLGKSRQSFCFSFCSVTTSGASVSPQME